MKIRIGIVGTGSTVSIGDSHVKGFKTDDRAVVCAVYNRTFSRSEDFINKHSLDAVACKSFEEMLNIVDGVVICTPNNSHVEYAIKALEKNVAVLLEKPISNDFNETLKLMEVAKTSTAFGMVGYTNRFSKQVELVQKLVKEKMTKIFHINITYGGQRCANPNVAYEWRMSKENSGAGSLIDYGSHAFDLIRFVCGVEIQNVFCNLQTLITERKDKNGIIHIVDNDDIASINAIGKNRETCSIVCSRLGFNGCTMTILGDGGTLKAHMRDDTVEYIKKQIDGAYSGETEIFHAQPHNPTTTAFENQSKAFVDGILKIKNSSVCSFRDAFKIENILNACEQSNEIGKIISLK